MGLNRKDKELRNLLATVAGQVAAGIEANTNIDFVPSKIAARSIAVAAEIILLANKAVG